MNYAYSDTRQYTTHAEWCSYLGRHDTLQASHEICKGKDRCVVKKVKP